MQICLKHWTMLRSRITALGLDQFIAKDGLEAVSRVKEELEGGDPSYDPLMSVNWMIVNMGLQGGGLYLMTEPSKGEGHEIDGHRDWCPICEGIRHRNANPDNAEVSEEFAEKWWIEGPTDAAYQECVHRGMVKTQ